MKQIGRGIGWVHKWFAKPLFAGSIPAPASIKRTWAGPRAEWLVVKRRFYIWKWEKGVQFAAWLKRQRGPFWGAVLHEMLYEPSRKARAHRNARPAGEETQQWMQKRMGEFHRMAIDAATERSEMRDKLMAVSIELSKLKRASKTESHPP